MNAAEDTGQRWHFPQGCELLAQHRTLIDGAWHATGYGIVRQVGEELLEVSGPLRRSALLGIERL